METVDLTIENVVLYAMANYHNPSCVTVDEFDRDLGNVKNVKRLLRRYDKSGVLKERLILNHIMIMINVFGVMPTCRLLFVGIECELWGALKPFLLILNALPSCVPSINGKCINTNDLKSDEVVIKRLAGIG